MSIKNRSELVYTPFYTKYDFCFNLGGIITFAGTPVDYFLLKTPCVDTN
jgi:hypothetical protein